MTVTSFKLAELRLSVVDNCLPQPRCILGLDEIWDHLLNHKAFYTAVTASKASATCECSPRRRPRGIPLVRRRVTCPDYPTPAISADPPDPCCAESASSSACRTSSLFRTMMCCCRGSSFSGSFNRFSRFST
jgi:hypothetical protein